MIGNLNSDHLINTNDIINGTRVALDSKFAALDEFKLMFEELKKKAN